MPREMERKKLKKIINSSHVSYGQNGHLSASGMRELHSSTLFVCCNLVWIRYILIFPDIFLKILMFSEEWLLWNDTMTF